MLEAAKAFHYGLTWQQAIRVVTMNPAKAIELSERIGFLYLSFHHSLLIDSNGFIFIFIDRLF